MKNKLAITDIEKKTLSGKNPDIGRDIAKNGDNSVVNAKKLLDHGKLITLHKNPQFVSIPMHTHDYIELCYMRKGQTTHVINGKQLLLCEGEALILNQHATQEIMPAAK